MYAIYGNIYHQYTPNVSIYTIHGSYGIDHVQIYHGTMWDTPHTDDWRRTPHLRPSLHHCKHHQWSGPCQQEHQGCANGNDWPKLYHLVMTNIAMENGPFIDGFPINTSIYKGFSMAMFNNQRVLLFNLLLLWDKHAALLPKSPKLNQIIQRRFMCQEILKSLLTGGIQVEHSNSNQLHI